MFIELVGGVSIWKLCVYTSFKKGKERERKRKEVTCGQVWCVPYSECVLCISPIQVHTHTAVSSEQTHEPWTHTRSSGQPFMLWYPGSSWGFGALLKSLTSVMVLRVEREHWSFTPPTYNSGRTWDSNLQLLGYKYDSLTIRPQIVDASVSYGMHSANQRSTNQLPAVQTCQKVGTYNYRNQ